jgi:hypothetical protein
MIISTQRQGEEVRTFSGARLLGGSQDHPRQVAPYFNLEASKVLFKAPGQWTPQAQELYDLLILTFSDGKGGLADLDVLQTSAGLTSSEWEDLLQYTTQARQLSVFWCTTSFS